MCNFLFCFFVLVREENRSVIDCLPRESVTQLSGRTFLSLSYSEKGRCSQLLLIYSSLFHVLSLLFSTTSRIFFIAMMFFSSLFLSTLDTSSHVRHVSMFCHHHLQHLLTSLLHINRMPSLIWLPLLTSCFLFRSFLDVVLSHLEVYGDAKSSKKRRTR